MWTREVVFDPRNVIIWTQSCQLDEDFGSWVHSCDGKDVSILIIKALDIRLLSQCVYE